MQLPCDNSAGASSVGTAGRPPNARGDALALCILNSHTTANSFVAVVRGAE